MWIRKDKLRMGRLKDRYGTLKKQKRKWNQRKNRKNNRKVKRKR